MAVVASLQASSQIMASKASRSLRASFPFRGVARSHARTARERSPNARGVLLWVSSLAKNGRLASKPSEPRENAHLLSRSALA